MPREATACNIPGYRYWKPAGACLPVCNYKLGERHRRAFPYPCYTPQKSTPENNMRGKNRISSKKQPKPRVAQPVSKKQKGMPKIEPVLYKLLRSSLPPRRVLNPSAAQLAYHG